MTQCQYKHQKIKFVCDEPSIPNSVFCIFHDKEHYAEHEQEAARRFEEKVKESIFEYKPLDCIGYYLPEINFAKLLGGESFEQSVYFNETRFYRSANFSYAKFSEAVFFSGATFSGEANFDEATFSEGAKFTATKFSAAANFRDVTFSKEADFQGARFSNQPSFWKARFSAAANFRYVTFTQGASFLEVTFSKEADFGGADFSEAAYFPKARFSAAANFYDVTFTQGANFCRAKFSEKADFPKAKFSEKANFTEVTFSKEADFGGADFSEKAEFLRASFSEVNFTQTKYSKEAFFSKVTFSKEANFTATKFLDEALFLNTRFTGKTFFKYTRFEQPSKVTFDNNNLSNISFADTDITRIRFGDKIIWGEGKNRFTIIEEEWLKDKVKGKKEEEYVNVSLELVLSVYRNLRENYEFRLRYDEAGKLFIKEMELKRKYSEVPLLKENCWFGRHFSLTGLYYHLSRYGESISRPAMIGAITVFLSTLFWVTQSNPTLEPHFDPSLADTVSTSTFVGAREFVNGTQWLKGFERSLAGFIPLLSLGGETKVGIVDYIIKIFGGGLTFVLLAIALRRKFERKYTR